MFSNTPVATHRIRSTQNRGRAPPSYLPSHPLRRVTNATVNNRDPNAILLTQSADESHISKVVSTAIDSPPPSLSKYMETHSTTLGINGEDNSSSVSGSRWNSALENLEEEEVTLQQPISTGSPSAFRRYRTTPRHGRGSLGSPERSPSITRSPVGEYLFFFEMVLS